MSNTMNDTSRRTFLLHVAAGSTVLASAGAQAQATGPKVDEKDAAAAALGYAADSSKVDKKKYPKHAADQKCTNCNFFVGKATDAAGGCPLFAGKQVAGPGWCSAWVKKAG